MNLHYRLRTGAAPAWRLGRFKALLALAALTATAKAQDPNNPPSSFTRTYTYSGGSTTVTFNKQSVRGPNYEVYLHTGGSSFTSYSPTRPIRTYIGTLSGFPGAIAAGQLLSDGSVRTSLIFEDGTTWRGTGTSFTMPSAASWTPKYPTNVVGSGGAGSSVYAADVGLDLSYSYYNKASLSADEALERAEFSVIETSAIYLRDFAVQPRIGRIVLRTNSADDPSTSLTNLASQWNTVLPGVLPAADFDEATTVVVTGSGGLAYVSNIHTSSSYAWVSISSSLTDANFCTVWRHEFGHNWGSGDNQDDHTEGNTIMNGNGLSRFASSELAKMIPYRNTRTGVLDNVGSYGFPLPPRANADRAKVHFTLADLTLDVLANDSDSNGQSITISSFPSTSHGGASITRSVGTGPGGRDQLIYHPSSSITSLDYFSYRIQDSAGYTSTGWVMIQPPTQAPDPDIAADVTSVSSGAWSTTSVWSDAAVPAAGKNYGISSSNTVDSAPNNVSSGGTVDFAGDTLAVNSGGMLRLSHSSAGGNTTYTSAFDGGLILRGGSTLQSYNSNVGNVTRNLRGPLVIGSGTSTIRIQSDSSSSYTNALRVNDGIFGSGNVNLTGYPPGPVRRASFPLHGTEQRGLQWKLECHCRWHHRQYPPSLPRGRGRQLAGYRHGDTEHPGTAPEQRRRWLGQPVRCHADHRHLHPPAHQPVGGSRRHPGPPGWHVGSGNRREHGGYPEDRWDHDYSRNLQCDHARSLWLRRDVHRHRHDHDCHHSFRGQWGLDHHQRVGGCFRTRQRQELPCGECEHGGLGIRLGIQRRDRHLPG
ncbi:MAG: Ig-like domain-containing protein [Luteolibacter sp.]